MTTKPRNFPRFGGVKGKPRLEFARASPGNNKRQGTVVKFTESANWTAPAGTRILQRVIGKGADGVPASGSSNLVNGYDYYTQDAVYSISEDRYFYGDLTYQGAVQSNTVPSNMRLETSRNEYYVFYVDYSYYYTQIDTGNYVPPTTGAAATGFGQVFAGGPSGQPAPVSSFINVAVSPDTSYPISVPLGGYITIEY